MFTNDDQPLFNIGVIAAILKVHPETLRIWEKHKLIDPMRRNKQRLYSNNDVKRLRFINYFINEKGLNISSVHLLLGMYPCWNKKCCQGGKNDEGVNINKPCWMVSGTFCYFSEDKTDYCSTCEYNQKS